MAEKKIAAAEKVAAKPRDTIKVKAEKKYFDKELREMKYTDSVPYEITAARFEYLSKIGFVKAVK